MKKLKIAEVASKLSITQPSLYKIIKTLKIEIEKTSKGRYIWNESAIKKVKEMDNKYPRKPGSGPL